MDLIITRSDFIESDILNNIESVVWRKCYYGAGYFEIYMAATAEDVAVLTIGKLVVRPDDDMVGVIEKINIQEDEDGRTMLLVSGRCAKSLFARRIIYPQTTFTGTVWNRMYWMLYKNAVEPADSNPNAANRKIQYVHIADVDSSIKGPSDKSQYTGDNLMDAVIDLLSANDLGWKVTKDESGFTVTLIAGTDRTIEQTENNPVIFSDDFENLRSSEYTKDMTGYANVAFVAGEGEGSSRVWAGIDLSGSASGSLSDLDRYEMYVDARDLQKTSTDADGNEITATNAEYIAQLQARGLEKLKESTSTETFEGDVDASTYQYRVDYDVGDIVTIRNQYGITANVRITAVEETEDENGYTVTPIFADSASLTSSTDAAGTSSGTSSSTTQELLETVYPVGAVYISMVSTSPATLFGFGTWQPITDQFLLGAGNSYAAGSTGGSATVTLTVNQMPSHMHGTYIYSASGSTSGVYAYTQAGYNASGTANTTSVGGGAAHNNMPPYLAVYMWRRTA